MCFIEFKNPYFDMETKIRMLQRFILVHSYIYYHENFNVISDDVYDYDAQQLLVLMKNHPDVETDFSYAFKDFSSGTGFNLFSLLKPEHQILIRESAENLINLVKERG